MQSLSIRKPAQASNRFFRLKTVMARAVAHVMVQRRTRRALRNLDAHLLEDIGLTAQDAADEINRPLWR